MVVLRIDLVESTMVATYSSFGGLVDVKQTLAHAPTTAMATLL
jgi:hypothetical protein